jgi:hypothetical protein
VFAAEASAYPAGTSSEFFGVNAVYLRAWVSPDKASSLEGLAASMEEQRIAWARILFDQSVEELTPGSFSWFVPDTIVAALARHGIRGAGLFLGTAPWNANFVHALLYGSRARPQDVNAWREWVAAAAGRYGPSGSFWAAHPELPYLPIRTWEIGNEVNSNIYWRPSANPEHYARIYSVSQQGITAVDPGAKVMVAGLAPRFGSTDRHGLDVSSFLARMTAADPTLRQRIPAVGIHPYAPTAEGALGAVAQFRQAMSGAGLPGTPMIANEIGWHTQGPSGPLLATETQRSERIAAVASQFWRTDCGVESLAAHTWMSPERDAGNSEDWYGLADPVSGEPYPSGLAYGAQIRLALGQSPEPPPDSTLSVC